MTATNAIRDHNEANAVKIPTAGSGNTLIPLGKARQFSNKQVGAKAANLGSLVDQGFSVPDGVVLATGAFEEFAASSNLGSQSTVEQASAAHFPEHLVDDLKRAMGLLGDVPLAVRSSSAAEDAPQSSFAGQYETTLNVRGLDALREAVQRCWASAFSSNVSQYRAMKGETGIAPMAVLIQRLVPAQAAGVAFTTNPVTGDDSEVWVSAVSGLGDRLVSGAVTPDEWVVRDGVAVEQNRAEGALDADQALRIAVASRKIEDHFGTPQDIEWAMTEVELYILQARPITTLPKIEPLKPDFEVPEGFWVRDTGHFSKPTSPMLGSFYGRLASKAMTATFTEFGLLLERVDVEEIGGWNYLRIVPIGGKEAPAPPWWLVGIVSRIHPAMRKVVGRAREAARNDLGGTYIERWWNEWRDEFLGAFARSSKLI
jgi:pyruvate,water dikinase